MKKTSILFLAVFGLGMTIQGARADESGWHKGACKADAQKFCSDAKGRMEVMECMKKHQDDLSADCRANGEIMKGKMKAAREACEGDVEKFCKDVKPGGGAIIRCLKQHEAELSDSCKAMAQKRRSREKMAPH